MIPKTILIVEDEDDIRDSLQDAFEDEGYVVCCASNGAEGLAALRLERPAAVVLDLLMPVMTGNELYAAMQSDPGLAQIPVIVSTSDPARAPSGVVLIEKPIVLQKLLDAVAKVCAR